MQNITLPIDIEATEYAAPTEWRIIGAKGKSEHITKLCNIHGVKPTRLLEVGSGDGSILRNLSESGFCPNLYGLDVSQSGVDVTLAQQIYGLVSCQIFDGYNIPFEDGFFDVLVLSHVLEHVEYERALLREIKRVSKHQVIEIPLDCHGLGDPIYHLLGPSYGHINARTPDALKFLLSTEGIKILDELFGNYSLELLEYDYFVNNDHERSAGAVEAFRSRYRKHEQVFAYLPRTAQLARSSYYAVLTREEGTEERLDRAFRGVRQCLAAGQVQAAWLIFKYYVPDTVALCRAMDIASDAASMNPNASLKFLDRAAANDMDNAEVRALRSRIEASLVGQPSCAGSKATPSAYAESPRKDFLRPEKEYFKARFPSLAAIYRKMHG